MSDDLHKYPGNLKHYKVDAPASREPLVTRGQIVDRFMFGRYIKDKEDGYTEGALFVRDIYEAARAKDAELIQRLVDALYELYRHTDIHQAMGMIEFAASLGFKPTRPE